MPRSSRSKSHKQSKHTSKEVREYSDSEEDVKGKERVNGKEGGSAKVSKDLTSGEKRKISSQSRDGKDLSGHGNGYVADEDVVSKRRKEKADGDDRTDDSVVDKDSLGENVKPKETKVSADSRSKSSRRHDSASERKEDALSSAGKKDESKGGSRVDLKRKSEKDSGRKEYRDVKEKDRSGADKEKMRQDTKDGEVERKQVLVSGDDSGERRGKRGRENADWPIQAELQNPELEKKLEKRIRKRGEGSGDKDKYQDEARDSDDKRSSRGNRSKDERHGDKYREDGERYIKHREDKFRADADKDNQYKDVKYHEDCDRDYKHREDKYRDDGERDIRHKGDKHREDGDKNNRRKEEKCDENGDKGNRPKDDRNRENLNKDLKYKEEKHWEDGDRDRRHMDTKKRSESDKDKRARDVKYKDEPSSRDRTYESEMNRVRDDIKSSNPDMSPIYDDRASRYKEDKRDRRTNDKEDHSDVRYRSVKEQRSDVGKRSISGKLDSVMDRGRSSYRNADVDINRNHSRWRRSPSSSTPQDHYRASKLEESKYRDYVFEERREHNISSSREFAEAVPNDKMVASRPMEKSIRKDDNQYGEVSAERHSRVDARASPLPIVNKSPSSTSTERKYLTRSDVRRTLDAEESGQRGDGSRDYFGREGRGSREFPMETHLVDELSQADGDNISVSSPFTRNNLSGNSRSVLPPQFRTAVDNPAVFGSSEDENRSRSNNRHRRIGDSNIGRPQGNAWRGVPNWPSPVANGFLPFPHVPPPVGFHPVMQQFPAPIFGIRPAMELNHNLPYHMPDVDHFSSHGRQHGWRNSVDDLYPPPHGWDTNNSVFGEDSRVFGRLDDQNRTQMGSRGWETSVDIWKGQNSGLSTEWTSASQKADLAHPTSDQVSTSLQAQTEQDQPNVLVESFDVQSGGAFNNTISKAPNITPEDGHKMSKMPVKDDVRPYNVYLSKLDISSDLTQPELYEQFISVIGLDQNTVNDEDNFKILYLEKGLEAKVADKFSNEAIFAAINDSVFQKAMSLYEKQRVEYGTINKEKVSSLDLENHKVVQTLDNDKAGLSDDNSGGLALYCDGKDGTEAAETVGVNDQNVLSRCPAACPEGPEPAYQKVDTPCAANVVNSVSKLEIADIVLEDKSSTSQNLEPCDVLFPGNFEDKKQFGSSGGFHPPNNGKFLIETKCDPLHFSDVPSEACEAMMPESIQSESVNISRIHHSPESTH